MAPRTAKKRDELTTGIPDNEQPPPPVYYLTPADPESTTPIPWSPGDPIPDGAEHPGLLELSLPQFPVWASSS